MDPIGWLGHVLLDPLGRAFFLRALVAAILVGTVCAVVGTYVVLKGLAFIGDAVSHAAFPGVVASFLLGTPYFLGAAVAAVGTALSIGFVSRRTQLRLDTTVGVVFAGTFALGIFMYSTIHGFVMDLMGLLFGNVLLISFDDLLGLVALGLLVLAVIVVLWKELLYATFDPLGAAASGLPVELLEYVYLAVVALTIVVSLKAVGIILVVAMLVTPAATAQLLTVRFGAMMGLAILVGVVSAVVGLYVSLWADAASGATIVLVETAMFVAAMVLGPRTGLVAKLRRAA
jgi:ABC-type Mn2+/Zn2+ transport system permease subunit